MRVALLQLNGSDDPAANLAAVSTAFDEAVSKGAEFILTPEVTNCISASRSHQNEVLYPQERDPVLAALRAKAQAAGVWCLIGSLALKTEGADGRFANRSFLISPDGGIKAWYDKIHMFDVAISESETFRESESYRPGCRAVLAETPLGAIGLTICYDLRFAHLYRRLAQAGAEFLTVPAAFSPVTGAAHWEVLLRARAIETGAFILAPAQTGTHRATRGRERRTWGHSLIVDPWGRVLADGGTEPGVICVDLDHGAVEEARSRIPALRQEIRFEGPA